MQKTNFSRITLQLNNLFFGFLSDTWRTKSIGLISVLTGYFLFANFLTKFISEGKNELIMVPIIIVFIEIIIRIRPSSKSPVSRNLPIPDPKAPPPIAPIAVPNAPVVPSVDPNRPKIKGSAIHNLSKVL